MSEREEGERGLSDQDLTRLMDSDRSVRDRMSKVEKWDDLHPNGEGKVPTGAPFYNYDFHEYVQWVRVTRGRDNQRVVATFLLWWREGQPWRMGLAMARKRLPPNPYYRHERARYYDWHAVTPHYYDPATMSPEALEARRKESNRKRAQNGALPLTDMEWETHLQRQTEYRERESVRAEHSVWTGWWSAARQSGAQPTIEVRPIPAADGDTRWSFPEGNGASFKVRGSLLAQALFTLRMAGQQRVSVHTLRETVSRIQQG